MKHAFLLSSSDKLNSIVSYNPAQANCFGGHVVFGSFSNVVMLQLNGWSVQRFYDQWRWLTQFDHSRKSHQWHREQANGTFPPYVEITGGSYIYNNSMALKWTQTTKILLKKNIYLVYSIKHHATICIKSVYWMMTKENWLQIDWLLNSINLARPPLTIIIRVNCKHLLILLSLHLQKSMTDRKKTKK